MHTSLLHYTPKVLCRRWASHKSVKPIGDDLPVLGGGRDLWGQRRRNETSDRRPLPMPEWRAEVAGKQPSRVVLSCRNVLKENGLRRFCSIFSQLLQLFPRHEFQRAVVATSAERHARGFTCWGHFVAMLFCQLGRAQSLREICGGLASCEGRLAHLGIAAPSRTTLAYANAHRPWVLYQHAFGHLLDRCRAQAAIASASAIRCCRSTRR